MSIVILKKETMVYLLSSFCVNIKTTFTALMLECAITVIRYRTTSPPPTPQEKGDETSSPSNRPPCPQINLEFPMFTLTLQREKWKISEVY